MVFPRPAAPGDPPHGPGSAPPDAPAREPASAGRPEKGSGWKSPWVTWPLRLGLTIAVTWLLVGRIGITLGEALSFEGLDRRPGGLPLVLATALLLGGLLVSASLWGLLVGEITGRAFGRLAAIRIVLSANLGRYLPGRLWPVAVLGILARREHLPATVAVTAGVLGQAFSLAAAGILAVPILLGAGEGTGIGVGVLLGALVLGVAATSVPAILGTTFRLLFRVARLPAHTLPETGPSFGIRWLGLYLVHWGIYAVAFVLFVRSFGLGGDPLLLGSAFAASYLLGYLAIFAPAGLGVREGFLILFLRPELGSAALGIALSTRIWMTLVEVLPGGAFALQEVFRRTGQEGDDGLAG